MKTKEIKLNMTPITEDTFKRQGWNKISVGDDEAMEDADSGSGDYYFSHLCLYLIQPMKGT